MCGITGYLDLDNGVDYKTLKKMNDVIKHRGPDDEGFTIFNQSTTFLNGSDSVTSFVDNINDENLPETFLGFGHRRLSILDISENGHQPMTYFDSEMYITFNGEIYNYIEIRKDLIELGYKFLTECDTEVLLASYIEWGEECVSKFNGMWAFCIYNKKENTLFCSRDRLGQKPLILLQHVMKTMLKTMKPISLNW
ncbi:MAG: carbapenam-3-carboxylate synthase domain-containing protein [Clostridia bacterium]